MAADTAIEMITSQDVATAILDYIHSVQFQQVGQYAYVGQYALGAFAETVEVDSRDRRWLLTRPLTLV